MRAKPEGPTPEQCNENKVLYMDKHGVLFACWHPQWGGYAGRALVETSPREHLTDVASVGGCFDVWVWHDGEFPTDHATRYHYCDPDQLIEFGELVKQMQERVSE